VPWRVVGAVVAAAAVAVVLFLYGRAGAADSADVRFELAKAGITLFAVAILGGAVAAAFRALDDRRQEARRIDAYRAATADQLWDVYHEIKAARRLLFVAGFDRASGVLSAAQVAAFHERMTSLNEAQLNLEKLKRIVSGQPRVFDPHTRHLRRYLRQAERYVNRCIGAWEDRGCLVQEGKELAALFASEEPDDKFAHLRGFLGPGGGRLGIKHNVSRPVEKAAELIQTLRFGAGR
jgi:hypothetical protein